MINYIFKTTTKSYSVLVVVRADTLADARAIIDYEYEDSKDEVEITLVECAKEIAYLN